MVVAAVVEADVAEVAEDREAAVVSVADAAAVVAFVEVAVEASAEDEAVVVAAFAEDVVVVEVSEVEAGNHYNRDAIIHLCYTYICMASHIIQTIRSANYCLLTAVSSVFFATQATTINASASITP